MDEDNVIIRQKVQNPKNGEWIEVMYIRENENLPDNPYSIYWKGSSGAEEYLVDEDKQYFGLIWGDE